MTDAQKRQISDLRSNGYGYKKIAALTGISDNTVKSFCRRNKFDEETVSKQAVKYTGETTQCENCGKEIHQLAKRKKKRFCCDKCRNAWWNSHLDLVKRKAIYDFRCAYCGKEFHIYGDKRRKYCSHECFLADRFKGGDFHE